MSKPELSYVFGQKNGVTLTREQLNTWGLAYITGNQESFDKALKDNFGDFAEQARAEIYNKILSGKL